MADVFISYARQDQVVATRVAKALRAVGYDVWWDADLPAHDAYSEVIERNLEQARDGSEFFHELNDEVRRVPEDLLKIPQIGQRHGIEFMPPPPL